MIRTIFFWIYFIVHVIGIAFTVLIPHFIFRVLRMNKAARSLQRVLGSWYGREALWAAGAKVEVEGKTNLPDPLQQICFVSNHQSFFDILVVLGYITCFTGFIAKKELTYIPVISSVMKILGCVLIDRKSPRSSVEAIQEGVASIKAGNNMVLFPEGTRSRSPVMNIFKPGSLKLALRSKATIVPLTMDGTYKLFEEHGKIKPSQIRVKIHPPIETASLNETQIKELTDTLAEQIKSGFKGDCLKQ